MNDLGFGPSTGWSEVSILFPHPALLQRRVAQLPLMMFLSLGTCDRHDITGALPVRRASRQFFLRQHGEMCRRRHLAAVIIALRRREVRKRLVSKFAVSLRRF